MGLPDDEDHPGYDPARPNETIALAIVIALLVIATIIESWK